MPVIPELGQFHELIRIKYLVRVGLAMLAFSTAILACRIQDNGGTVTPTVNPSVAALDVTMGAVLSGTQTSEAEMQETSDAGMEMMLGTLSAQATQTEIAKTP